ncbi:MarR family winged helix-turn-helix transcriptional regulator [Nocardioides sp. cx-173]|uniref:MarR family winged helix-turn-helix transcriptional regulator n=1 Tax=Nocardioides sp. cx-173 TaxID=2898796 RepID=UPI001E51A236|nr:MarR family transcriptional regulator [Nocardioides sp. cx-173]MCD4525261.1 MarR family transcriptional regulator [Nocardioides sp. cx-173]UGB40937.1 MarR family transcriptional regulator [Nocardioides sp. cx-173]
MAAHRDRVDSILDHVRGPDVDVATKEVHIRLRRLAHYLDTEARRRLAPQGMEFWELSLLSSLVRSPEPLSVGALQDLAQVTPGAITHRIAKLEEAGAVRRSFDARDRRQVNVEITDAGRARFELLLAAVGQVEEELFADVDPALMQRLAGDLRLFMLATEGPGPATGARRTP